MTDINGRELQLGDHIILTVSRKSHYLTSALVESVEDDGVEVRYSSTIKTRKLRYGEPVLIYDPKPYELNGSLGLCKDCVGQIISSGQEVAYRSSEGISFGTVSEVQDKLWVILSGGIKVRNVGVFVL